MFWKACAGLRIHQSPNGIQVRQNMVYRWLTFDSSAIQTLINRRHPERYGLRYIKTLTLAARRNPAPSCLLGLGGAGVAHALTPYFKNISLDAIESDLNVIDVCAKYFMMEQIHHLHVIHQDAFLHVQHTTSRYQHLMIDLFGAFSFPAHCNNVDFFSHCRRVLLPEGILAVNLANPHEQWPVFSHIRSQFEQYTVSVPIKGTQNMIVLAYKGTSIIPLLNMLEKEGLKQLTWDAKWGCVARIK